MASRLQAEGCCAVVSVMGGCLNMPGVGQSALSLSCPASLPLLRWQVPHTNGLRLERTLRQLRLPDSSSTLAGTGCICGAPGTARLLSSSTRASAARLLAGASSNPLLLDLRVSAPTTVQAWVTAIPGRHHEPHAAWQMSWPDSSRAARSPDQWCSSGNPSRVSTFKCTLQYPERAAGLVLVDASHEDDAHEVPGMARFVPPAVDDRRLPTAWRLVRPAR